MVITFRGPMKMPGIMLPAGTYVFKLADFDPDRNIVQVCNKDENHLYGTFPAIPDSRRLPASSRGGRRAEAFRILSKQSGLMLNFAKNRALNVWSQHLFRCTFESL